MASILCPFFNKQEKMWGEFIPLIPSSEYGKPFGNKTEGHSNKPRNIAALSSQRKTPVQVGMNYPDDTGQIRHPEPPREQYLWSASTQGESNAPYPDPYDSSPEGRPLSMWHRFMKVVCCG